MSNSNHTVIIRNLTKSSNTSDSYLTDSIYDLLNTYMKISTIRNCIQIKTEDNQRSALIRLKSPTEVFDALDKLKDRHRRNSLGFKFQRIADTGEAIDVKMELPERYYQKGQNIGKETRKYEFKVGGGDYVKHILREDVSKYICGFLNGRTKGTLFIGVNDDGDVVGANCEDEDKIRCHYIDEGIRAIKPPIDNKDYQVEFIPVVENEKVKANCNVIEITVNKKKHLNRLFDSKGHVYLRREGSVRDFNAAETQDWILQNHHSRSCILQ
ncbi:schlafen-like protein 1 [Mytilus californianus]|uniref:schlafen-like protein 1 n=1 Tax=Mytilus californianus TaxID=6549 RepID=UPI0022467B75|nr:schlafen-like protein 1 [Mytilus californianus]